MAKRNRQKEINKVRNSPDVLHSILSAMAVRADGRNNDGLLDCWPEESVVAIQEKI